MGEGWILADSDGYRDESESNEFRKSEGRLKLRQKQSATILVYY
jgi:hypothetical protein